MVSITVLAFLSFLRIAPMFVAEPSSKDVDVTSLNEHMKKIDALLQEVQSHAQAQEQKYSAVLSSVLSQLTQTTEELSASRNVSENLQLDLENLKQDYKTVVDELAELKESHNKTLLDYETTMEVFEELKQAKNQSLLELEMLEKNVRSIQLDCSKSVVNQNRLLQLNSTETEVLVSLAEIVGQMNATGYIQLAGLKQPWLHKEVGFEADLAKEKNVPEKKRIVFDRVTYNVGNGYNESTGTFTAPVSGTYMFWTNIVYRTDHLNTFVFYIRTSKTTMARAYGSSYELFGTASTTSVFYLQKGEITWMTSSRDVELEALSSSVGAVLIKQY